MAEQLTEQRVQELVRLAKTLSSDEINVLIAAFGLNIAQDFACTMVEEDPEEYEGQDRLVGMDMIEPAVCYLEDWFGAQDMYDVNERYRIGDYFDVALEMKLVATPRK